MTSLRFTLLLAAEMAALLLLASIALAHGHYTDLKDPVTNADCCGDSDCNVLDVVPGVLETNEIGYVVTLTGEQARAINPARTYPVTFTVPWARVQPSWDGKFHVCIAPDPYMGHEHPDRFYCFWAPPNS